MAAHADPPVIFLMGPTASGKTDLAVELASRLPVEVVSVDSGMVYRGMDIGTAKPPPEVLARVPHRLTDICDPGEAYSAGRFRRDALREIASVRARGRMPLLVGGTGLYFRALQRGIAELPDADPAIRARLLAEAAAHGWPGLHARLARVDPVAARRIRPSDPQRIQRALEVQELTGRPISELQSRGAAGALAGRAVRLVLASPDRELARRRIAARFHAMLERGFLREVEALYRRGDLGPALPSMRLVGYRQAWKHLAGELDLAEMTRQAIVATQQLAKRQRTWLRAEQDVASFDPDAADLVDKVLKFLGQAPI
jgi:tRNA dimethylallyltransferase